MAEIKFVDLISKMSSPVDPEISAKKWSKSGQIGVPPRFFENISRNSYRKNDNDQYYREFSWGGSASSSC